MKWILPEYVEDILPAEAKRIESLRRKILDLFFKKKYELVMPPLLEFTDSLFTGTGIQIGAEMFGDATVGADVEVQALLCDALAAAGMKGVRLGIGHVAVFRSIAQAAKIDGERESELFEALQKKDLPALKSLTKGSKARDALLLLPELYGDAKVLDVAEKQLPKIASLQKALATLRALAKACPVPTNFDLAELRGYHYHSGVVFDAYCDKVTGPAARGGRYDDVGKAFGRSRPATGFSIDLRALAGVTK
jgi:ATP phosphoribosyltransferase regulatory subunit